MLVLELASSTGSSRGRSSKTTKKSLFKGAGSSKCWFWNWPAAPAAAGAGVPKPPKIAFYRRGKLKMLVLELASSTGSSRGRSSKTTKNRFLKAREAQNAGFGTGQQHGQQQGQEFQNHQKSLFKGAGSSKCWFWNWQQQGQEFQNHQKSLFKGAGSSKCWFWNWPAARAAAGAGVPKPPKNRLLKAREAQNAGFGTGQQHGQQQGQEFQNRQKIAF